MADSFNVLTLKLDQMAEKQDRTDRKVSELTERVLNPESGVFARAQINDILTSRNRDDIDELHEGVEKLLSVCETHEKSVSAIEGWMRNHEERDNDLRKSVTKLAETVIRKFEEKDLEIKPLREDHIVRSSNKVWKDKIIYFIITVLLTSLVLPPVINLYKESNKDKPKVESIVK